MEEELDQQKLDLSSVPKDDDDDDGKSKDMTLSYRELATATNNFRQESLIGEGGFGAVYKGQLHTTGQVVAVKQLNHSGLQGEKEFLVEVVMLSHLRHPNLVNLIGYCAEGEQRLLVYQFMPLGSLEDRLHNIRPELQPLDWNRRMTIAVGAANGLNFLHNEADPPVIYRDLKSSNILLDQDCLPKLSDFGLAKFDDDKSLSHASTTRVMGTQGYCAPEYACTGKLSTKSDIYSFGVVLLELITGRRPLDMTCGNEKHTLVDWARPILKDRINKDVAVSLADPLLRGQFSESSFCKAMDVALMCIREDAHLRPSMKDVVLALNNLTSRAQYYDPLYAAADHHEDELMINDDDRNFDEETSNMSSLNNVEDRERAVAEAKVWGETWREKGRHLKHNLSP